MILAAVSLGILLLCVGLSFAKAPLAGTLSGGLALTGLLLAAYSFIAGLRSFREKDTVPTLSVIGSIAGGIMAVAYFVILVSGLR